VTAQTEIDLTPDVKVHPLERLERFVGQSADTVESDDGYFIELEDGSEPYVGGETGPYCNSCAIKIRKWLLRHYEKHPPEGWTRETVRKERNRSHCSELVYIGHEDEIDSPGVCRLCWIELDISLTPRGAIYELDHFHEYHATSSREDSFGPEQHFEIMRMFYAFGQAPDYLYCPEEERERLDQLLFRLAWWMMKEEVTP